MASEPDKLRDFATRYTEAWCSQNPLGVALHYAVDGHLRVNDGTPAVGREEWYRGSWWRSLICTSLWTR
jgi:hypothetical protein